MITRRELLTTAAAGTLGAFIPGIAMRAASDAPAQQLTVGTRTLDIKGRAAKVFGITSSTGAQGLILHQADGFHTRVLNQAGEPTVLHWHGLTPPNAFDGSNVSQTSIAQGQYHDYQFDIAHAGTNWMHSHHGLQEAALMAAPLIILPDENKQVDRQDVVLMLHDFSFTSPEEILAGLKGGTVPPVGTGLVAMIMGMIRGGVGSMDGMDHGSGNAGHAIPLNMDLNDVTFDAFLANDRDLSDPDVVGVEKGGKLRLRIINAASATNFWIDLGTLQGTLVAADGRDVSSVFGNKFEIGMAQRLDIDVTVPTNGGAFPLLAQREGDTIRTGVILATAGAKIRSINEHASHRSPPVLLDLERQLLAQQPLETRQVDRAVTVDLTGDMMAYSWGMNGKSFENHDPINVVEGERVELTLRNRTMMSHPMHLHGHHFQVTGLGRARLQGAIRDTIMVPAQESVTIEFDATNPGEWPLHCHNMYHLAAGMMTTVEYSG